MSELKPCPFCGAPGDLIGLNYMECRGCGAEVNALLWDDRPGEDAAWNAALEAAAEMAVESIDTRYVTAFEIAAAIRAMKKGEW